MKLWLVSQDVNRNYDTFDSFVVAAETEDEARLIHKLDPEGYLMAWVANVEDLQVEYLGEAKEGTQAGEILGSFNAG